MPYKWMNRTDMFWSIFKAALAQLWRSSIQFHHIFWQPLLGCCFDFWGDQYNNWKVMILHIFFQRIVFPKYGSSNFTSHCHQFSFTAWSLISEPTLQSAHCAAALLTSLSSLPFQIPFGIFEFVFHKFPLLVLLILFPTILCSSTPPKLQKVQFCHFAQLYPCIQGFRRPLKNVRWPSRSCARAHYVKFYYGQYLKN